MKEDLIKLHHARSQHDFPGLNLEEREYVEFDIRRTPIGVGFIWGLAILAVFVLFLSLGLMWTDTNVTTTLGLNERAMSYLYLIIVVLLGVTLLAAAVTVYVYKSNRLVVTNNRLFHYQALSLFAKSTNVIDLSSIEDVSYSQVGLIDYIVHIGTIRLSTVGDETTYTFKWVSIPKDELDAITHLVHVAKEKKGR